MRLTNLTRRLWVDLFALWLSDNHRKGHPIEALKYHGFRAAKRLHFALNRGMP